MDQEQGCEAQVSDRWCGLRGRGAQERGGQDPEEDFERMGEGGWATRQGETVSAGGAFGWESRLWRPGGVGQDYSLQDRASTIIPSEAISVAIAGLQYAH